MRSGPTEVRQELFHVGLELSSDALALLLRLLFAGALHFPKLGQAPHPPSASRVSSRLSPGGMREQLSEKSGFTVPDASSQGGAEPICVLLTESFCAVLHRLRVVMHEEVERFLERALEIRRGRIGFGIEREEFSLPRTCCGGWAAWAVDALLLLWIIVGSLIRCGVEGFTDAMEEMLIRPSTKN